MRKTYQYLTLIAMLLLTTLTAKAQYLDEGIPDFYYFNQYGVFLTPEGRSVVTITCDDLSQEQIWNILLERAGYFGSFSASRVTVLDDHVMIAKEWFGDLGTINPEGTELYVEGYISVELRVLDGAILMGAPRAVNPMKYMEDDEERETTFANLAATYFDKEGNILPEKMDAYLLRVFWVNQWLYRLVWDFIPLQEYE